MASTQPQSGRKRRSGSTRRRSRPLIGITTSDHKSFLAWWCDWISVWRAGGRPLRISPARPLRRPVDGLIIGGGDDIGAQRYGGEMQLDVRIDPARDELELELLARYLPERIPILGICRGAQIINIHCGGSLIEDIQTTYRHIRNRRMVLPRKRIEIEPFSQLADILNRRYCHVNSLHHQAVDRPGDGLKVVAHDRDDLVQAIESDRHPFLIGVQWHPEFLLFSRSQQRLIRALVDAALERKPAAVENGSPCRNAGSRGKASARHDRQPAPGRRAQQKQADEDTHDR